jgi:hypothetical protein
VHVVALSTDEKEPPGHTAHVASAPGEHGTVRKISGHRHWRHAVQLPPDEK